MKPIAWWTGKWDDDCDFMSERIRQAHEERGSFTPRDFPVALYTADDLKAAQVAILQEAARQWVYAKTGDAYRFLRNMADKLKKSK